MTGRKVYLKTPRPYKFRIGDLVYIVPPGADRLSTWVVVEARYPLRAKGRRAVLFYSVRLKFPPNVEYKLIEYGCDKLRLKTMISSSLAHRFRRFDDNATVLPEFASSIAGLKRASTAPKLQCLLRVMTSEPDKLQDGMFVACLVLQEYTVQQ